MIFVRITGYIVMVPAATVSVIAAFAFPISIITTLIGMTPWNYILGWFIISTVSGLAFGLGWLMAATGKPGDEPTTY